MKKCYTKLAIFFDGQFWIGVVECIVDDKLTVYKRVFGEEPKNGTVYELILNDYYKFKFSSEIQTDIKDRKTNPKRIQRKMSLSKKQPILSTKTQKSLKLQQEQSKTKRKQKKKQSIIEKKAQNYELKKAKRKQKHKGH